MRDATPKLIASIFYAEVQRTFLKYRHNDPVTITLAYRKWLPTDFNLDPGFIREQVLRELRATAMEVVFDEDYFFKMLDSISKPFYNIPLCYGKLVVDHNFKISGGFKLYKTPQNLRLLVKKGLIKNHVQVVTVDNNQLLPFIK